MNNVNLNPGGVLGSLLCGGLLMAFVVSNIDVEQADRGTYRLPLLGFVGGAFAGNFLWSLVFGSNDD